MGQPHREKSTSFSMVNLHKNCDFFCMAPLKNSDCDCAKEIIQKHAYIFIHLYSQKELQLDNLAPRLITDLRRSKIWIPH